MARQVLAEWSYLAASAGWQDLMEQLAADEEAEERGKEQGRPVLSASRAVAAVSGSKRWRACSGASAAAATVAADTTWRSAALVADAAGEELATDWARRAALHRSFIAWRDRYGCGCSVCVMCYSVISTIACCLTCAPGHWILWLLRSLLLSLPHTNTLFLLPSLSAAPFTPTACPAPLNPYCV